MPNIDGIHPSICPSLSGWSVHTTTRWCIVAAHECKRRGLCQGLSQQQQTFLFLSLSLSWCYFQVLARRESSWMPHHVHTRIEKRKRTATGRHLPIKILKKGEKKNFVIFVMLMRVLTFRSSSSIQKTTFVHSLFLILPIEHYATLAAWKELFFFFERSQHTRTDPFYNIAI